MTYLSRRRTSGVALIEAVLSAVFMTLILGGFALLMRSARGPNEQGVAVAQLQDIGRRIIVELSQDLKNAGIRETGGGNFPSIYERPIGDDKTPRGPLVASMSFDDANDAQYKFAHDGDQSRIERNRDRACDELVFTPIDFQVVDGGGKVRIGWPLDTTNNDQLKWSGDEVNYRVVRDASGTAWLERRVNDKSPTKVAPFVDNITFDCLASDRTLLFNQIAIVVYLGRQNGDGRRITTAIEGVVNLGVKRDQ